MSENDTLAAAAPAQTRYEILPVNQIDDPEYAMRTDLSHESIAELVTSIKQVGLIEPIVVKQKGDRYEVIAGHRRITACEAAGLTEVPCHIVIGTEEQMEMMKIHENLMRVDVNPFDEAQHYDRLMSKMKLTPGQISRLTNRGESYVRDRLQILTYSPELQEAVALGKIRLGVGKELNRITDPMKQREMLGYAMRQGITQAHAKRWVEENQPATQPDPGFVPAENAAGEMTPASEQHADCFYCLNPVRLWDAYTVYVHNECAQQRRQEAAAPEGEPEGE
jgi:ParB/RepB/Spo0J family partition protein